MNCSSVQYSDIAFLLFWVVFHCGVSLPFVSYAVHLQGWKPLRRLNFQVSLILAEACKALTEDKVSFWRKIPFREATCTEQVTQDHHITCALTAKEAACALPYIVTLHKEFETSEIFFRELFMLQNVYCVHVDAIQGAISLPEGRVPFSAPPLFPGQSNGLGQHLPLCTDLHCTRDLLGLGHALVPPTRHPWAGPLLEEQQGHHPAAEGLWRQEHHTQAAATSPHHHLHQIRTQGAILLFLFFHAVDIYEQDAPSCKTWPSILALPTWPSPGSLWGLCCRTTVFSICWHGPRTPTALRGTPGCRIPPGSQVSTLSLGFFLRYAHLCLFHTWTKLGGTS